MDLTQLRSFVILAERLHFGQTARLLNLSQPALTKRIRQLESEIGGALFERTRNGTRLSNIGRDVLNETRNLVRAADQLLERAQRVARGDIGSLSIGFGFHTFDLVPRIVARLKKISPEVHIGLRDMSTREQVAALRSMEIDVGFIRLPASREFNQKSVVEDALVLVSSSALSKSVRPISLNDYRQEPFVMMSSQRSPTFRRHAIDLCAKHGFVPKIVQEANDVPTLMALARAGIGLTFLPASACKTRLVGVKVHPIPDPEAIWSVGVVWRRGHPSIVLARFLDLLDEELACIAHKSFRRGG
jgi:DNA-binding transcriptional LysR family regulator